ncbi:sugar phosphate permease [Friedmanniella endophytica]|uniref:Sugar phosphate permease n=1 Tax=Microlunatus kandeliicorticis TaxID=1759536 RepID=A0A7W3P4Q5_9ACTN|nr:MFS transporter [Microlunatus kandeliicorticis]MBA8793065.1 sugar phosphate permease [Microlunatus kandeliicorticis]
MRAPGTARRWAMLGVGLLDQAVSAYFVHGAAFLLPELGRRGYRLAEAGVLVAMPTVGVMLTLIMWGIAVDRFGERRVLITGLTLTAAAGAAAALSGSVVGLGAFLLLGGMAAASSNAASGRIVVGWFPARRRGLAMGIRQMAQPLGVGIAALTVPTLAQRLGLEGALWLPAALAAVAAVTTAVLVVDPPRPSRAHAERTGQLASPYRRSSFLWRVHGVSVLLVVPQFTVWTFSLVWLIADRGWAAGPAGLLVALTQLLGAAGRLLAGQLSDSVGSRMRPLRWVAVAAALTMLALGVADELVRGRASLLPVAVLVVASVITVADNGLAFTSIAEVAGPFWSGRALGAQNTAQFLAASAVAPGVGALIGLVGYGWAFALVAVCPAVAVPLVPGLRAERAADRERATQPV